MPSVATSKPQTISYPHPGSRPSRHDDYAAAPHVVVLFGATGDLARRKLIPGLAYLDQSDLAPHIQIVATSLEDISTEEFLELAKEAIEEFGTHKLSKEQWGSFSEAVTYVPQSAGPEALAKVVGEAEAKLGPEVRRLHYLSVPPKAARAVITMLRDANFVDHIQIDIPETLGLDERANFYESTGAYKDMVVTHLFQVMAFVVMEPPT